jgi:hypothetical protein
VRPDSWARDVCGAVGAWEGQLEAIGDDVELNNIGARQNDGASGDHVEGTPYVRSAIDRVIEATDQTLQRGLERAGIPDTATGEVASRAFLAWAQTTENELRAVEEALDDEPNTTAAAFRGLGEAVAVLERSAIAGREVFELVAGLEPELGDAFDSSGECRRLRDEDP